ncbi:MAG: FixH family protein [Gammaproteobacteria bacterium]|nr:FixH family protein [Gammaproteobacteria bacterium]
MSPKLKAYGSCIAAGCFILLAASTLEPIESLEANTKATNHSALMLIGEKMLHSAEAAQAQSIDISRHNNSLRNALNQLRRQTSTLVQAEKPPLLGQTIDLLANEIPLWQQQVSLLRGQALTQRNRALRLLKQAYLEIWRPHIRLTGPIMLAESTELTLGHNVKIRSVHANKQNMNLATKNNEPTPGMSLAIPAVNGQDIPRELNLHSFQISRNSKVFAHVEPETASTQVPLNRMHQWRLILSQLNGEPLSGADIEIEGHMPGHVHGLPTQPQVTTEIAPGVYRVEGVKFQMPGWWVMTFNINNHQFNDAVTFNIRL